VCILIVTYYRYSFTSIIIMFQRSIAPLSLLIVLGATSCLGVTLRSRELSRWGSAHRHVAESVGSEVEKEKEEQGQTEQNMKAKQASMASLESVRARTRVMRITGDEKRLPKDLIMAVAKSAAQAGVRGGPPGGVLEALDGDDHDHRTTSLIGKEPTEMLEKWQDKGSALVKKVSFAEKAQAALDEITASSFETKLKALEKSAKTRYLFSRGNKQARAFLLKELQAILGDKMVSPQQFNVGLMGADSGYEGVGVNLIGKLEGTEKPDEYVVLGAHYDTVPQVGDAPGADDNGSGTTALLLAAKALAQFPSHKRSILFVSFSGEEEGLWGSTAFVKQSLQGADDKLRKGFKGAIIMDQVGFKKKTEDPTSVIFETSGQEHSKQQLIDTLAVTAKSVLPNSHFDVNYHGWGSDHMPFLDNGFPAVLLIERDNLYSADNYGHTPKDQIGNINFNFAAEVAKLAAATVANIANPDEE